MSLIFLVMLQIVGLRIIKVHRYIVFCVLFFGFVALDIAFRLFRLLCILLFVPYSIMV